MTASEFINRAFTRLGIRASETSLQADEIQDGLDMLNDMLAEWDGTGILPGASPVMGITDEIRAPRFANLAIINGLAVRLAPDYSRQVSPALILSAADSYENMVRAMVDLSDVNYPGTLPYGSGSDCDYHDDREFFPQGKRINF